MNIVSASLNTVVLPSTLSSIDATHPHLATKPILTTGATMPDAAEDDLLKFTGVDFMNEVRQSFGGMGKELISSKINQRTLFEQSAADGGPANANEAILNLMDYCKVGIRKLSVETKVRRKLLLSMIHGRVDMPQEVLEKIYDVLAKAKPALFATRGITSISKVKM